MRPPVPALRSLRHRAPGLFRAARDPPAHPVKSPPDPHPGTLLRFVAQLSRPALLPSVSHPRLELARLSVATIAPLRHPTAPFRPPPRVLHRVSSQLQRG